VSAVPEPDRRLRSRRELLLAGGAAAAAVTLAGSGRALAAGGSDTAAVATGSGPPESESSLVYRLLSAELLLLFTYEQLLHGSVLPPDARRALAPFRGQEQAHVRLLKAKLEALGGAAPKPPANEAAANQDYAGRNVKGRLGQLQGADDALRLLIAVERVVVGAYFVALTKLEDRRLIALITRIMANDAQHEALIGALRYPGDPHKAVPFGLVQGVQ
jgi:hypothetical protein